MKRTLLLLVFFVCLLCTDSLHAQGNTMFDKQAYKDFLHNTKDLTGTGLQTLHPAGIFQEASCAGPKNTTYLDSILKVYALSDYQKALLLQHGFVVIPAPDHVPPSFANLLGNIHHKDLPVYVSSDAILHSVHMSYNAIFKDLEESVLSALLDSLLRELHQQVPDLAQQYASNPIMSTVAKDIDFYLTVPRILLGNKIEPALKGNTALVQEFLGYVAQQKPVYHTMFTDSSPRTMDFSQFIPRGRYTQSEALKKYFQAMMWLGRTEFYLIPPRSDDPPPPSAADMQRQTLASALLAQMLHSAKAAKLYNAIETIIATIVGESDNVTPSQLEGLMKKSGSAQTDDLLEPARWDSFEKVLQAQPDIYQKINSQILSRDVFNPDSVIPAASFLLFGQRFIIDSYILGNVVFDKVKPTSDNQYRFLPSGLDMLFAIGNDAAGQLLKPEIDKYQYAPQLAATRYIVDSYDSSFWTGTLYNNWLNSIRMLNPPKDRSHLPAFMQTGAWWQFKMNSQLAAWSQLRHDNLLYAKPSYSTGGIGCSFPHSYVEPVPDFFNAITTYAQKGESVFKTTFAMLSDSSLSLSGSILGFKTSVIRHFQNLQSVSSQLGEIARKEIQDEALLSSEEEFLKKMLYDIVSGCSVELDGWYPDLFYNGSAEMKKADYVVVDVHTAPTDEDGNMVGWVMHTGTGDVDLAIIIARTCEGENMAYIGPVMSCYERVTTDFVRLTDEEWTSTFSSKAARPDFTHLYMTAKDGNPLPIQSTLAIQSMPPLPAPLLNTTDIHLCQESSLLLDAGAGYATYLWSNGAHQQQIAVTEPGTYSVTVSDGCRFATSKPVEVQLYPHITPEVTRMENTLLCNTMTAQSFQWKLNDTVISGATMSTYTATVSGSYSVDIVDANGCVAHSPSYKISVINSGIPEGGSGGRVRVMPNPVHTVFTLEIPWNASPVAMDISLYTLMGQEVLHLDQTVISENYRKEFSIQELPAGVYYVHIRTGSQSRIEKLVKH